jgi:hypothetical protein
MHRHLLPSALLLGLATAIPASAETLTKTLDGTELEMHMSCVKSVSIDPQPDLQGKIQVEAKADALDEIDPLEFSSGTIARIDRKGDCRLSHPTLTLAIKVPPATAVDLSDAGSGDYRIGALGALLRVSVAGSGTVHAAETAGFDARVAGSGSIDLDRVNGPGKIEIRGSGDVTIRDGVMPTFAIELRGSGNAKLSQGSVGVLAASLTGSGNVRVGGTVRDASLSSTGSGNIDVTRATGAVQRSKAGSGEITVGK